MKHHYLKILPDYYDHVKSGDKTFEVRFNDRDYQVNDVLHLQEFNNGEYTGRELVKVVSYILNNSDYCKEGYVILAIKDTAVCTKRGCPKSVEVASNCNLTEHECHYFTRRMPYDI